MGQVGYGVSGWVLAGWQQSQAWRRARHVMTQQFLAEGQAASVLFATAWANQADATGELARQAAASRADAAAKQKQAAAESTPAALPERDPIINAGGAIINLEKNTIRLADGTVLDIRSGTKLDVTI